jgi:hypothetical protein
MLSSIGPRKGAMTMELVVLELPNILSSIGKGIGALTIPFSTLPFPDIYFP